MRQTANEKFLSCLSEKIPSRIFGTSISEIEKEHIRVYIRTRSLLGFTATEIHRELTTAYGHDTVSFSTVAHWIRRFASGRDSFEDDPRSGRPVTIVTPKNITAVEQLVNDDPHISIDYIASMLGISYGSVDTILRHHLRLRKISSRWVPHSLTAAQRQKRVDICTENLRKLEDGTWRLSDIVTGDETWIYHRRIKSKEESKAWISMGGSPATEVRRQQFERKTMFVIFFMTNGPLLIHEIPPKTSINAVYYRDECLSRLARTLHKKRPFSTTHGIKLHHDNARPHVNNLVLDYLRQSKITVMAHPPYSPDLAPCDFWLFDRLKRNLDTYPDSTSLSRAVTKELNSISIDEYRKTFHKWMERMKFCVEHDGNYFEHLM